MFNVQGPRDRDGDSDRVGRSEGGRENRGRSSGRVLNRRDDSPRRMRVSRSPSNKPQADHPYRRSEAPQPVRPIKGGLLDSLTRQDERRADSASKMPKSEAYSRTSSRRNDSKHERNTADSNSV